MRDLVFLPDREGRDELTSATGFVRCGADASSLRGLAERLVVRGEAGLQDTAAWRGMLALALLADVWPDEGAKLSIMTVDATTSPFAAWVLAARPAEERREAVRLVLLEKEGQRRLLGVVDAHQGLKLPATPSELGGMMPVRARWYDRENGKMTDPVSALSELERRVLRERMALMGLDSPQAVTFMRALAQVGAAEEDALRAADEEALAQLSLRMQAVCGLKDFEAFSVQAEPVVVGANPLFDCLKRQDTSLTTEGGMDYTYLWHDVPFARSSRTSGLMSIAGEAQEEALVQIAGEMQLMSAQSMRWNRQTAQTLQGWLDQQRSNTALLPQVREQLEKIRQALSEQGRNVQMTVTLEWPWTASGAVRALLQESLGDGWMQAAENPFSDRLTKLTGHVLGDTALQTCCACADGVLLPPLSRAMAACVANAEEGAGLALDALRFQPREDGGITASILLRGMGEIRMVRTYPVEEITVLTEAESPCVAVWPCLPMPQWHAYHVFQRGGSVTVEALRDSVWTEVPHMSAEWRCLHTESYPACLVLMDEETCLGALPNMLPVCQIAAERDAVAAIDLGTISTATVLSFDGATMPAEGQPLTRLLVQPQNLEPDDFLMSLTPGSVVPTAVELIGAGEELFTDGFIYRAPSFASLAQKDPSCLYTSLKWRADAASVRARKLLLHQVMLGASLTAVMNGARSIQWRVTVADEMGEEGRSAMLDMMEELAGAVALETGLPLPPGREGITWAEEAAALYAYLRGDGGFRGSFAVLDLGGGSTKLHLWLQGREGPAAGAVLLDGVQKQLASALCQHPELVEMDFADCADPAMKAAADALCEQLRQADSSLREADKATLMLTTLMDEFRQPLTQHLTMRLAAQRPTYLQAILLELQTAALYTAGLMLAQVGDDAMISHRLPEDVTICLSGRGAWLLDTMPPAMRNSLQHLTRSILRLDHPVRFVTLKASPQPALGTALGMAVTKDTQKTADAPAIRTRASFAQLMCDMMRHMAAAFPIHTWMLHEGLFDQWGGLTEAGEDTIRRMASVSYGDGEDIPASVMAFVQRMRLLPISSDLQN